jgi:hypothetical protein
MYFKMTCPKCSTQTFRESCHNGIMMIYGPYGCPECGWSENPEYDCSHGPIVTENGSIIDQWGMLTPAGVFNRETN